MNNKDYQVKMLKGNDRLAEIREVRRRAWEASDNADLVQYPEFVDHLNDDNENDIHFIIEDSDRIIAAARLKMKNELPSYASHFSNEIPTMRPFGELERFGIIPEYRGLGLSYPIDTAVLEYAKAHKIPFLFATVIPPRDKTIEKRGYKRLGISKIPTEIKEVIIIGYFFKTP